MGDTICADIEHPFDTYYERVKDSTSEYDTFVSPDGHVAQHNGFTWQVAGNAAAGSMISSVSMSGPYPDSGYPPFTEHIWTLNGRYQYDVTITCVPHINLVPCTSAPSVGPTQEPSNRPSISTDYQDCPHLELTSTTACVEKPADVVFVVDSSSSITPQDYATLIETLANFLFYIVPRNS